ncbi:MAG: twin-arginine translocase subunit TatC [Cytophagales bacterium]|nr:twin-arginine translocase subunit TatC [Cytophaga sp.]
MSFLDHLEELRKHIIRSVIAVLVFSIIAFIYMDVIFREILMAPSRPDFFTFRMLCTYFNYCVDTMDFKLISRTMTGQFTMHMLSALITGLIVAFPYIIWELWKFISPALHEKERKHTRGVVFGISILFFIGILFGYYIISPLAIDFLANYKLDPSIENSFDVTSYISTLCLMALGGGVIFQLPVVVYFLSSMGLLTPMFMRQYRRHAVIVMAVISAILTPSPDVLSQLLMGVPMYLLYEISIYVSAAVYKRKLKEAEEEQNA